MSLSRQAFVLACGLVLAACADGVAAPPPSSPVAQDTDGRPREGTVPSADGVPIHFTSVGAGDSAVVLVHCWSCSTRYWDHEVKALSPRWRVVAIDLGGHGASGKGRKSWTIASFGEDVRAVVSALGLKRVVLVGHSMGGPVTLEAAKLMPDKVVGLVPVDTLHDVEKGMAEPAKQQLFARMRQDFKGTTEELVRHLFVPTSDRAIVDRVVADMTAADPEVAIPAFESLFQYAEGPALEKIKVPIRAINTDVVATNLEANRRHAPQFDVVVMKGVGHWLMLEKPDEFDQKLIEIVGGMHL